MRWERVQELLRTAERHTLSGRFGRAIAFYRKVLFIAQAGDSEWELAQVRLGDLHLGRGETQIAVAHLTKARLLNPRELEYALMLGRALRMDGRPEEAQFHIFDAFDSPYHRPEAYLEMAIVMADMSRRADARIFAQLAAKFSSMPMDSRSLMVDLCDA